MNQSEKSTQLVDRFGRVVNYLRISITDRCDFRCQYCMAENMTFLPRAQVLTLEEIEFIAATFVELGVKKIRITGGEPLVRNGALKLLNNLGQLDRLNELVVTTNGSQLKAMASPLRQAGVRRLNISLDSLNPEKFRFITRTGDLATVLQGIDAARAAGFERIKINSVIQKGFNDNEIDDLVSFALENGLDISFIEEMPLGIVNSHNRAKAYYSSEQIKQELKANYRLLPLTVKTGGPSVYYQIPGYSSRIGFISPHSANFCSTCNRVRLTADGRLLLCLGNEHSVDLKRVIRANPGDKQKLKQVLRESMQIKPEKHEFNLKEQPVIFRHMNVTGG